LRVSQRSLSKHKDRRKKMTNTRQQEDYLEAQRTAAAMVAATLAIKYKLKRLKQPITDKGRHGLLKSIADLRGLVEVMTVLAVCARRDEEGDSKGE